MENKINCPEPDWTQLDIKDLTIQITPSNGNNVRFEAFCHFDPSAWYIPGDAYNKAIEKATPHIARGLRNASINGTRGIWGERMKEKKEYYDWMKNVVDKYKEYLVELEEDKF